jgi:hypothetical protein
MEGSAQQCTFRNAVEEIMEGRLHYKYSVQPSNSGETLKWYEACSYDHSAKWSLPQRRSNQKSVFLVSITNAIYSAHLLFPFSTIIRMYDRELLHKIKWSEYR